ncbi:hypothetical protein MWH28_04335 [Natroniella sulfidigena]|uniref:tetratricopeptide repeat protein n=1 Tax=Natroniella sulfidigena TaxID=723921 RepID=UPI00200B9DAF|nr:hypothetical protein [Natroniella sulfidigena]MCK8816597.1 hypothetical protein [Natroniella sulfidigena]
MKFLKKLFNSKKYGGVIESLDLIDFWDDLDDPKSNVTTSKSTSGFLNDKAGWAISDKKYDLAEKLLLESINRNNDNSIDLHFTYNHLIKLYYKLRDKNDYLDKCIDICKKDIALYEEELKDEKFFKKNDTRIPSFQRLVIIYEKQNKYKKAIKICEKAIKYSMRDTTKSGFEGRLKRLKKKAEK